MKIFLHTRPAGEPGTWTNTDEDFAQVPAVGEYVARDKTGGWAEVYLVVHLPKSAASDYAAEVFAINRDHLEAHRRGRGNE